MLNPKTCLLHSKGTPPGRANQGSHTLHKNRNEAGPGKSVADSHTHWHLVSEKTRKKQASPCPLVEANPPLSFPRHPGAT